MKQGAPPWQLKESPLLLAMNEKMVQQIDTKTKASEANKNYATQPSSAAVNGATDGEAKFLSPELAKNEFFSAASAAVSRTYAYELTHYLRSSRTKHRPVQPSR